MTLEEYIAAWNERYDDRIVADRVKCIWHGCDKSGADLIVPDSTDELLKCPDHDSYLISTPRSTKEASR